MSRIAAISSTDRAVVDPVSCRGCVGGGSSFSGSRARPCGGAWASRSSIDGSGQAGAIAGPPAHDHCRTRPSFGRIHPCSPEMIAALSKTAGRKKTPREAGPECSRQRRNFGQRGVGGLRGPTRLLGPWSRQGRKRFNAALTGMGATTRRGAEENRARRPAFKTII